jgi:photosystem II stability/assembly factor-like uncharacterized protein
MIHKKILFIILSVVFSCILSGNLSAQSNWNQTNGPKNGLGQYQWIYSLEYIDGSLFAGTDQGFLFKSTDKGVSWEQIWNFSDAIWTIKQNMTNGDIYIGTQVTGLFKSTDGGVSFSNVFDPNAWIGSIGFDNSGNIYAGTELYGIFRSTNNGQDWTHIWDTDVLPLSIVFNSSGDIFAGTITNGIYKSTDGGSTWESVGFNFEIVWSLIIDENDNIYAGMDSDGLYKSENGGSSWSKIGLNSVTANLLKNSNGYLFAVDSYNVIYESKNDGLNWINLTEGMNNNEINCSTQDELGFLYLGTGLEGVFKSIKSTFPPMLHNTIITSTSFCAGVALDVDFTYEGGFNNDNDFYIELSDAAGSFVNAMEIGRITSFTQTAIQCIIPADMPTGNGYRIRVSSTSPAQTANINSNDISINSLALNLTTPLDNAENVVLKPEFSWNINDCVTDYRIIVASDVNFLNVVIDEYISSNSFTPGTNLELNTNYWWKVASLSGLGDEVYTNVRTFKTAAQTEVTHSIQLGQGWNMISTYVLAVNPDMFEIFNSILNDVIIVKNGNGDVFIPSFEINNIGNWNIKDGYQIYMQNAMTLDITGEKVDFTTTQYNLNAGWTIISYIKDIETSVIDAFASLSNDGNLVIVKDNNGNVYIPEFGIDNIHNLIPGQAYYIYLKNAVNFTYPN